MKRQVFFLLRPAPCDEPFAVDHPYPLARLVDRYCFVLRDVLRDDLPDPRARLPRAGDEKLVIAHFFHPRLWQTRDYTRQRGRRDAADVVVERRRACRVPLLQTLTVLVGEVFKLDDDAIAEPTLHGVHELVHQLVVFLPERHPRTPLADVQRVV